MAADSIIPRQPAAYNTVPRQMGTSPTQTVFEKLPDEIIQQILHLTTPNAFASLILLNRQWRKVSQQADLYAYQLSRSPSYAATHHSLPTPSHEGNLPRLRRLFAREMKRNLFEAYLRPRRTTINLVSNSISVASAPGGEAFQFSLSPTGRHVLAYSSSRIHIINVTGQDIKVERELKILRRPASATVTDSGSTLAILSTDLQIDLYDMNKSPPKHIRVITLDYSPRTIALSPTGSVLAASYDSGIEVLSLEEDNTIERRAVKCYGVDSLSFSKDGRQLLGTTSVPRSPSTVILTAPYYDPASQLPEESVSALWTTSILFPNGSRDCSHAVLLPSPSEEEANWAFTYDRVVETFRAVRVDDLRNGTTYFTGPIATASDTKLMPSTLPAASRCGDLVAAGFQGSIWLYGIPEDLEALPTVSNGINSNVESVPGTPSSHISLGRRNSAPSLHSGHRRELSHTRLPQWQLLCDRFRNNLVEGRNIASFNGVTAMSWVNDRDFRFPGERLVLVSPGVCHSHDNEADGMNPVDGGRLCFLDFGYSSTNGENTFMTIEVGLREPETLEEEHRDLDSEVAIVRRRTVAQRRSMHRNDVRSTINATARPVSVADASTWFRHSSHSNSLTMSTHPSMPNDLAETASMEEEQHAFNDPYSRSSQRSGTTLRRAATAGAVNRQLYPRSVLSEYVPVRRADGREEHPYEGDADDWIPPPPPYSKDPVPPLPDHIQRSVLADNAGATMHRAHTYRASSLEFPGLHSPTHIHPRLTSCPPSAGLSREPRLPSQRSLSETTSMIREASPIDEGAARFAESPVSPERDDLYDVSPPGTPRPNSQMLEVPVSGTPGSVNVSPASTISSLVPQEAVDQPIAPIPHSVELTSRAQILSWDRELPLDHASPPSPVSESSAASNATEHLEQDVIAHPVDSQPLKMPPSLISQAVPSGEDDPLVELPAHDDERPQAQLSISTVSSISVHTPNVHTTHVPHVDFQAVELPENTPSSQPSQNGLVRPSAEQLARLNSRKGRPERLSSDFSQPSSGSFSDVTSALNGLNTNTIPSRRSSFERLSHNSQNRHSAPPRAAIGAFSSPPQVIPISGFFAYAETSAQMPQVSAPSSRVSMVNHIPRYSSSSPRPSIARLDTIQSITTNPEPQTPFLPESPPTISGGLMRKASNAKKKLEKSAGQKKKTFWRKSMSMEQVKGKGKGNGKGKGWEPPIVDHSVEYSGWTAHKAVEMEGDWTAKEKVREKERTWKRGEGRCTLM